MGKLFKKLCDKFDKWIKSITIDWDDTTNKRWDI
jgi:hypothetical protein